MAKFVFFIFLFFIFLFFIFVFFINLDSKKNAYSQSTKTNLNTNSKNPEDATQLKSIQNENSSSNNINHAKQNHTKNNNSIMTTTSKSGNNNGSNNSVNNSSMVKGTSSADIFEDSNKQIQISESKNNIPTSKLPTITVVATKTAHNSFDLPFETETIDMDSVENVGATSLGDIFSNEAGISHTGTRKNGQDITMRGYDDRSINFVIDGVRQNFYSEHDGSIFLDPFLLKSVDVAYGSTSSLYGNGGLGGTILFTTKDAKDLLDPNENFGARVSLGYDSVNNQFLRGASTYGRTDKLDYVVSANYTTSGDIKLGNGDTLRANDKITSFLAKASYTLNNNNSLYFNTMGFYNNGLEPNAPDYAYPGYVDDSDVNKDVHNSIASITHKYMNDNNTHNITTKLYVDYISIEEEILTNDPTTPFYDETGEDRQRDFLTYGVDNEHVNSFATGAIKHTLLYGAEVYQDKQKSSNTLADGSLDDGGMAGVPEAHDTFAGTYLQDELMWKSSIGKWYLVPGVRYDYYTAVNTTDVNNNYYQLSPKLGLSYKPIDNLVFFTNYAHGFRAPKMTEIFATGPHFPSNHFVENPDLKPESNDTVEAGFGIQQDFSHSSYSLRFSTFATKSEDFIDLNITAFTTQYVNVEDANLHGFSAEGTYSYNQFDIKTSYAYTTGKSDTGEYLTNIMPHTIVTNFIYNFDAKKRTAIGYRITYAADFNQVNPADEHNPYNSPDNPAYRDSYFLNDIYYQIMPLSTDNLTIYLGIDNIFDVSYQLVSSYYEQPGRNFKVLVSYKW
ncbi:Hemin receptor [Candidatus Hepatincola sp. Pdp]